MIYFPSYKHFFFYYFIAIFVWRINKWARQILYVSPTLLSAAESIEAVNKSFDTFDPVFSVFSFRRTRMKE